MNNLVRIKWRNVLSYGNAWTEYDFTKGLTLITGKNGEGKSAITECIYYALFGKTYRNITLSQLINSINKKELEVILDLNIKTTQYRIHRGMKANILLVYKKTDTERDFSADDLVPVPSNTKTYQNIIEEEIIHQTKFIFEQTSFKSLTKNMSFLTLPKATKREIVESILGIDTFGQMTKIAKEKFDNIKNEIVVIEKDLNAKQLLLQQEERNINNLKRLNEDKIDKRKKFVAEAKDKFETLTNESNELKVKLKKVKEKEQEFSTLKEELEETESKMSGISDLITTAQSNLEEELELKKNLLDIKWNNVTESFERAQEKLKLQIAQYEEEIYCIRAEIDIENKTLQSFLIKKSTLQSKLDFMNNNCFGCEKAEQILTGDSTDTIGFYTKQAVQCENKIKKYQDTINDLQDKVKELKTQSNQNKIELDTKSKKYTAYVSKIEAEYKQKKQDKIKEINDANSELKETHSTLKKKIDEVQVAVSCIAKILASNESINRERKNIESELEKEIELIAVDESGIASYKSSIEALDSSLIEQNSNREHIKFIRDLLSDDGIKTFIIRKYLPVINKILNSYLQRFQSDVVFKFNEQFDEVIESRFKDSFSYESFSEGQKRRIDLAILFTFIEFAKVKFPKACNNILILDEVGAGLDSDGFDILMTVVEEISQRDNKNVIMLSPTITDTKFADAIYKCEIKQKFSHFEKIL